MTHQPEHLGVTVLLAGALLGCAAPAPQPNASVAGARQCIPASQVSGRYVDPPNAILIEAGRVNYRSELRAGCPEAARLGGVGSIVFETSTGGQICRGDRVRIFDPRDANPARVSSASVCVLGPFVPIPRS